MARERQNLFDLMRDHEHEDRAEVTTNSAGLEGDLARLASTLQQSDRVLVVFFSEEDNKLEMRSLQDSL